MKKLMFCSGKALFPAGQGGAEIIAHDLLNFSACQGNSIECVGSFALKELQVISARLKAQSLNFDFKTRSRKIRSKSQSWDYSDKASIFYSLSENYHYKTSLFFNETFLENLDKQVSAFEPDLVFLQAEEWFPIMNLMKSKGIKTVLYVQNGLEMDGMSAKSLGNPDSFPDLVLANSQFISNKISSKYPVSPKVLYPAMNFDPYFCDSPGFERPYITFINPVKEKGVEVFIEVAMALKDFQFLAVEGWGTPEPIKKFLLQLPNVTYWPHQSHMKKVYEKSRLLLVPSQWEEAFGRVSCEAQASGIPVIASRRGGIPEAVGEGGILIDEFQNPKLWIEAISSLLSDQEDYQKLCQKGQENIHRFPIEVIGKRFLDLISS